MSVLQHFADHAGADDVAAVRHGGDDTDLAPRLRAEPIHKIVSRAGSFLAEGIIKAAYCHLALAIANQGLGHEFYGRKILQLLEFAQNDTLQSRATEELHFLLVVAKLRDGLSENVGGMLGEAKGAKGKSGCAVFVELFELVDQSPMTAVHTVKIAEDQAAVYDRIFFMRIFRSMTFTLCPPFFSISLIL